MSVQDKRARDELMRVLRSEALVSALVKQASGLSHGDNFDIANDCVHGSLRHHRFLDVDANQLRRQYVSTRAFCNFFNYVGIPMCNRY